MGEVKTQLYDYQRNAIQLLKETDSNLLVIAPTGAGKTLIGFEALKLAGKGAYIGPTRALMFEKYLELLKEVNGDPSAGSGQQANGNGTVTIGNKDYSLGAKRFENGQFAVISPWKLEQLMASSKDFESSCPVAVIDEAHHLDADTELIYTLLKVKYPLVRRVALSATIHEDDENKFTAWLDAVQVKSEDRPVPLIERVVHFDADITDAGEEVTNASFLENGQPVDSLSISRSLDRFGEISATIEYIRQEDDSPILIFTPSRNHSAFLVRKFGFGRKESGWEVDPELKAIADSLPLDASEYTRALKVGLTHGIGLHNGSLTQNERETVQTLASQGKLDIIVSCYTLGQGVNLPARHIIFASVYDYSEEAADGSKRLIDVSTFRQIEGRAGRPQFDTIGYCWIPVSSEIERVEVEEVLLKYKASKVESRIYNEYFFTAKLPMLVHLGFNTPGKLAGFMQQTFWGQALQNTDPLVDQFEKIFKDLVQRGVIGVLGNIVYLTSDGQRLARLGIHPDEYEVMKRLYTDKSLDYESWVSGLASACCAYVFGEYSDEAIETLVANGLTVYTQKGMGRVKDLADYVSRLLDIARSYFKLEIKDFGYNQQWQTEVRDRFTFGQLEVAKTLAKVLDRDQLKRVVRNLGIILTDLSIFAGNETALKGLSRIIWGASSSGYFGILGHIQPFSDAEYKQIQKVAEVLGVDESYLTQIAQDQRVRVAKGQPVEDAPAPRQRYNEEDDEESDSEESFFDEKVDQPEKDDEYYEFEEQATRRRRRSPR